MASLIKQLVIANIPIAQFREVAGDLEDAMENISSHTDGKLSPQRTRAIALANRRNR